MDGATCTSVWTAARHKRCSSDFVMSSRTCHKLRVILLCPEGASLSRKISHASALPAVHQHPALDDTVHSSGPADISGYLSLGPHSPRQGQAVQEIQRKSRRHGHLHAFWHLHSVPRSRLPVLPGSTQLPVCQQLPA